MKKYLKYIPLLISLILMLYLNLQDSDSTLFLSNSIRELFKDNLFIYTNIRKIGHTIEFFILGICTYIPFKNKSILIDALLSLLDQTLKIFIPTRHFDITDIPYDMLGYLSAFIICLIIYKLINKYESSKRNTNSL